MADSPSQPDPSAQTQIAQPPGQWTARLALLVALLAAVLGAYLFYLLIYLAPFDVQAQQTQQSIDRSQQDLLQEMDMAMSEARGSVLSLAKELEQQNQELQSALESAVYQSLEEAKAERPTTPRQWRLAEAAFLLRMANYSMQFEKDVRTALQTLQRADEVLQALQGGASASEYDLLAVRAALAQELLALKQVEQVDIQGIYVRLQALAGNIPTVRESLELRSIQNNISERTNGSFVQTILLELERFVRITDLDELRDAASVQSAVVDAGPMDKLAATRNVLAALERAQIAVLRRQQGVYSSSMEDAQTAAAQLGPASDRQLQIYLQQLAELADLPLQATLPNISGSLSALNLLMETP